MTNDKGKLVRSKLGWFSLVSLFVLFDSVKFGIKMGARLTKRTSNSSEDSSPVTEVKTFCVEDIEEGDTSGKGEEHQKRTMCDKINYVINLITKFLSSKKKEEPELPDMRFSKTQLILLEALYKKDPHPNDYSCKRISKSFGIHKDSVKIWFEKQNEIHARLDKIAKMKNNNSTIKPAHMPVLLTYDRGHQATKQKVYAQSGNGPDLIHQEDYLVLMDLRSQFDL